MNNDLIKLHILHIRSRCRAAYEVSLIGAEAKKSAVEYRDELLAARSMPCNCPRCGRKLT